MCKCALLFAAWSTAPARALLAGIPWAGSSTDKRRGGATASCTPVADIRIDGVTRRRERRSQADVLRPLFAFSKRQNSRPVGTEEITEAAKIRATSLVDTFVSRPASASDMRCIEERQLRHKAGVTIGVSPLCRHSFPQAFAFDPCGHKISSGLFRLSCPLLVQAIDRLEDEGGIEDVNARLERDHELREDFMTVNLAHGKLRRRLITPEKMKLVEDRIGAEGAEKFLGSGITGVTAEKVLDAKCLHAHVADALMRGRDANAIGRATLDLLEARGVPTEGSHRCREQCDFREEETEFSWRYTPRKNKQRLLLKKVRRKGMKRPKSKTKASAPPADEGEARAFHESEGHMSHMQERQVSSIGEARPSETAR